MKSELATAKGTRDGEKGQLMAKKLRRTRNEIGASNSERYRDGEKGQLMAKRLRKTQDEMDSKNSDRRMRLREGATGKRDEADTACHEATEYFITHATPTIPSIPTRLCVNQSFRTPGNNDTETIIS